MNTNSTYSIDFHSLKANGEVCDYEFEMDDSFFGQWPESEVSKGSGTARVRLLKRDSMMELTVLIDAGVTLNCDRCLDDFHCLVHFEGEPVVKISGSIPDSEVYVGAAHEEELNNSDGDVLWISPADDALNLGQYIYESIILSLPFQRVHPNIEDCNSDMLDRFQIVTDDEFVDSFGDGKMEASGSDSESPFAVLKTLKSAQEESE